MIRELVAAEDVDRIMEIQPSRLGRKDGYTWKHTKSGSYSVKSGYDIINEQRKATDTGVVEEPSVKKLKKEVWKLKTSRKIKHFIWQALAGFVTTASRLCDRHCATDRTCLRCGAEEETINHLLFECPPSATMLGAFRYPNDSGRIPV